MLFKVTLVICKVVLAILLGYSSEFKSMAPQVTHSGVTLVTLGHSSNVASNSSYTVSVVLVILKIISA